MVVYLIIVNGNAYGNGGKAACEAEAKRGGTSCLAAVFQHNVSNIIFSYFRLKIPQVHKSLKQDFVHGMAISFLLHEVF